MDGGRYTVVESLKFPFKTFQSYAPFSKCLYIQLEKVCPRHLNKLCMRCIISCDKLVTGGMLVKVSISVFSKKKYAESKFEPVANQKINYVQTLYTKNSHAFNI